MTEKALTSRRKGKPLLPERYHSDDDAERAYRNGIDDELLGLAVLSQGNRDGRPTSPDSNPRGNGAS